MRPLHRALIQAIVHLATAKRSADQEDDDVRALESILAELTGATPAELDPFLAAVRAELEATQNPARRDALEGIIDSLTDPAQNIQSS